MNECPNCGTGAVEVTTLGDRAPRYFGACPCWPQPPSCPTCRHALSDGRCVNMDCPLYDVIQPCASGESMNPPPGQCHAPAEKP